MGEEGDEPEEESGEAERPDQPEGTGAGLAAEAAAELVKGELAAIAAAVWTGPPVTLLAALIPPAFTVAYKGGPLVWRKLAAQWQRRWGSALRETAKELNIDVGALEEQIANSEKGIDLFARVIEAAARTPLEQKITALGRVLAEGLREDANFDEAFMLR